MPPYETSDSKALKSALVFMKGGDREGTTIYGVKNYRYDEDFLMFDKTDGNRAFFFRNEVAYFEIN